MKFGNGRNVEDNVCLDSTTSTPANSGLCFSSTLDAINAVSSAVDVLAFIQSQCSNSSERVSSRSVSLREMMRRATSASRTISGLDMRDTSGTGGADREEAGAGSGAAIPTLSWPPDPPVVDSCRPGRHCFQSLFTSYTVSVKFKTSFIFSFYYVIVTEIIKLHQVRLSKG